ncbi:UNVERIFIED_CONTAM: hypothetical protein FKN15_048480 [Acipenser sinensis]
MKTVTKTGLKCQAWSSMVPHEHSFLPPKYRSKDLEDNYCRNPDNEASGPWCFTTDPDIRHQSCEIPQCSEVECLTCNGENYRGSMDHTETGKECQRWDLNRPHKHAFHPKRYPDKGLDDNYCRNPDKRLRPWCFTLDLNTTWEYCSIKVCAESVKSDPDTTTKCFQDQGEKYRGTINTAPNGIRCQRWDSQYPHNHSYTPQNYKCQDLRENYCRNPDGAELPWCFTTDPKVRVAFCTHIPRCGTDTSDPEVHCYNGTGEDYRGHLSKTRSGFPCAMWDEGLKSKRPAWQTEHVRIIQLPVAGCVIKENIYCTVYGWGETKGTGYDGMMKAVKLPIVGNKICNEYHKGRITVTESEVCAGGKKDEGVCEVLSGCAIIVRGQPRGGPPPERQINLSNVRAGALARRAAQSQPDAKDTPDEPWAFQAREYLRKKMIGKEICFTVENKTPQGREYGMVYLGKDTTGENIAESLVAEGLASVRREGIRGNNPDQVRLCDLEDQSKSAKKGMWGDGAGIHTIRDLKYTIENPRHFIDSLHQKPVNAVIEHVRDGAVVRALLLPDYYLVTVMLSGIKCPSFKREPDGQEIPEPFAAEAKFFTESRLLQRDVQIILESCPNQVILGTILHPEKNKDKDKRFRPLYDIPYMFEAREFLRKKLTGKKVNVTVDYIRAATTDTGTTPSFPERTCSTVTIGGINIAEALISKGLATVIRYRQDDDQRSSHYDELLAAEARAIKNGKGLHSKKEVPIHRVADISGLLDVDVPVPMCTPFKLLDVDVPVPMCTSFKLLDVDVPMPMCTSFKLLDVDVPMPMCTSFKLLDVDVPMPMCTSFKLLDVDVPMPMCTSFKLLDVDVPMPMCTSFKLLDVDVPMPMCTSFKLLDVDVPMPMCTSFKLLDVDVPMPMCTSFKLLDVDVPMPMCTSFKLLDVDVPMPMCTSFKLLDVDVPMPMCTSFKLLDVDVPMPMCTSFKLLDVDVPMPMCTSFKLLDVDVPVPMCTPFKLLDVDVPVPMCTSFMLLDVDVPVPMCTSFKLLDVDVPVPMCTSFKLLDVNVPVPMCTSFRIDCPRGSRNTAGGIQDAEPFSDEACLFTKELVLQREQQKPPLYQLWYRGGWDTFRFPPTIKTVHLGGSVPPSLHSVLSDREGDLQH